MLATMANGLPYSIGAAVAYPGPAGGLRLSATAASPCCMGEMATLVKYKLPVKVIIIKNNTLGQIKWEQMVLEGNPEFGVELQPIDFAAYARACGAAGFTMDDPAKAEEMLRAGASPIRGRPWSRRWSIPTSRRCPATPR